MDGEIRDRASAVLSTLAQLSPTSEQRATGLAISTEWFRWLPLSSVFLFQPGHSPSNAASVKGAAQRFAAAYDAEGVYVDKAFGERLAAVDQVRSEQRALRIGWLFVAGQMVGEDGKRRRVFHPLVTMPVRVRRAPMAGPERAIIGAGDAELSALITDQHEHRRLEQQLEFGGGALERDGKFEIDPALLARLTKLVAFARAAASAAGLPAQAVVPAVEGPDQLVQDDTLQIVAGVGVYTVREAGQSSRASSLRAWAAARPKEWTAFHSVYLGDELADGESATAQSDDDLDPADEDDRVDSPFLLTPVQRTAVMASRRDPLTLVSGAPGTGKSHAIGAIACDAVARGESVLVAAKSEATVDALLDLLERSPGPAPVVFGSNDRRRALAERLAAGQIQTTPESRLDVTERAWRAADAQRAVLHDALAARLWAAAAVDGTHPLLVLAHQDAPRLFDPQVDLADVQRLCATARAPVTGWWSRWRRRRAGTRLRRVVGAPQDTGIERIDDAIDAVRMSRAAGPVLPGDEVDLRPAWEALATAVDRAREARGVWLEADSRSERRIDWKSRATLSVLGRALRSGRSARRDQLAKLQGDRITDALPLWVGTLADIDDLLPPEAALFDLVVLDEASSIDQPLAATALLRGRRAVVAGDPRQLRQVSFVSDSDHREAVTANGLDAWPDLAARLDVRRNSTFDLTAGATPVLVLDEHFRSDPHLVDFVADRLYGGRLHVATRSPRTESIDCIDVVRVDGRRDKAGAVQAELTAAVDEARRLLPAGGLTAVGYGDSPRLTSVGIVTPFRAQADALEAAVLAAFTADELETLDLRVGTAHAFQGNERDVVIVSMGVGPDESAGSWRFVEDPHLFAVLMTRARRRLVVLVSTDPPAGGLIEAYLAQADAPPGRPRPVGPVGSWTTQIADELAAAGLQPTTAYPSGRHTIDIVVGDRDRAVGIECQVHPDGPEAHIERHLALRRQGWELHDAFEAQWGDRRGELVVDLLGRLRPPA